MNPPSPLELHGKYRFSENDYGTNEWKNEWMDGETDGPLREPNQSINFPKPHFILGQYKVLPVEYKISQIKAKFSMNV